MRNDPTGCDTCGCSCRSLIFDYNRNMFICSKCMTWFYGNEGEKE